MQPHSLKNITRYTYVKTAFQGWRVCISRRGQQFTRYFSDKAFGSEERALAAARELRDQLLTALSENPDEVEAVFARFR